MDVIDTRTDVTGISFIHKHLEQLSITLAVLNAKNIGIESGDGVEEVLEFRVAEVRVDLGAVLDTGGGKTERVDSPLEVGFTLLSRS